MPFPGRVNEHRKSRSYCRTERPNRRKSLLGSQLSLNTRSKSAVPAQPGAPDGTHPPCGVRTFPPFRQLKCISDGKGKRGRKGWKTVGCPSLAFRSPSKGSFQSSQLHGKYSDSGCGASRKKKTVPIGDGFHEPYGFRKYPGGVFSRNLADFKNIPVEYFSARLWLALPTKPENLCSDETAKDSQAINGERKVCATSGSR